MIAYGIVEVEKQWHRASIKAELLAGSGRLIYHGTIPQHMVPPTMAAINTLTDLESFERVASPQKLARSNLVLSVDSPAPVVGESLSLALCMAILGELTRKEISASLCFTGVVGPAGEIIPVEDIDAKRRNAPLLGFDKLVLPMSQLAWHSRDISQLPVKNLIEAFSVTFYTE